LDSLSLSLSLSLSILTAIFPCEPAKNISNSPKAVKSHPSNVLLKQITLTTVPLVICLRDLHLTEANSPTTIYQGHHTVIKHKDYLNSNRKSHSLLASPKSPPNISTDNGNKIIFTHTN